MYVLIGFAPRRGRNMLVRSQAKIDNYVDLKHRKSKAKTRNLDSKTEAGLKIANQEDAPQRGAVSFKRKD